jgi:hypothetical protein
VEEYINQTDYVSFAELASRFGRANFNGGDRVIELEPNLILWGGLTQEASDAVRGLLSDGIIAVHPSSLMVYMADGCIPRMPIAKRIKAYKKEHWLPVTLRPAKPRGRQP